MDNLKEGQGREEYHDGTVFEGSFSKGKKVGIGKLFMPDGSTFEGNFNNDVMEVSSPQ